MGSRSRERRKAKLKARQARRRDRAEDLSLSELFDALMTETIIACHHGNDEDFAYCLKVLVEGPGGVGEGFIDGMLLDYLRRDLGEVWRRGWQPADVARIAGRRLTAAHVRLAVDLMAVLMREYASATVDRRWAAQLAALGASSWWDTDEGYLAQLRDRERVDRHTVVRWVIETLTLFRTLPEIPLLCPPPGSALRATTGPGRAGSPGADQRMLDRVRALLAKAESTEFPEEAEAFTAKAQELMARHSIDHALLMATTGGSDTPYGIRIGIDNPYEQAKALLLQKVAEANRCRPVWSKALGFGTVFGFAGDLDSVELLYTSLLVQATTAMVREGSRKDRSGRSRTRSFRLSFLNAYAIRIGERLYAATEQVSRAASEAEGSDRLLPVLAARDDAVREALRSVFGEFVDLDVRITDGEGWASGRAAADLASLNPREALDGRVG
jgi:hypothetical protein